MCSNFNLKTPKVTNEILLQIIGCYAQKFGARGYGYLGMSSLGLMSDIKDKDWQRYLSKFRWSVVVSYTHTKLSRKTYRNPLSPKC